MSSPEQSKNRVIQSITLCFDVPDNWTQEQIEQHLQDLIKERIDLEGLSDDAATLIWANVDRVDFDQYTEVENLWGKKIAFNYAQTGLLMPN